MDVWDLLNYLVEECKKDPHFNSRKVILSSDAEGNKHSPLASVCTAAYRADTTWSGEVGIEPDDPHTIVQDPDDVIHDGVRALVLYPVN